MDTNQKKSQINLEKLISDKEVADLLGIGRSTVWKFVQDGHLPAPLRFGNRCSRWRTGDVLAITSSEGAA